ncbi:MAG: HAMP domain-containing protein [Acidobacteria bacterium]|nr:HAMP domain-containing protein [Acidobacteriota bacterium]
MTFRTRLLLVSSLTIAGAVALVTGAVSVFIRRTFDRMDEERRTALVTQFQQQMKSQGDDVARKVERVANADSVLRLAMEATRPDVELGGFLSEAQSQAESVGLDFLDLVRANGTILSSAHWQARFSYPNNWTLTPSEYEVRDTALVRVPLPEGEAVALAAARKVNAGIGTFAIGARRLDASFLSTLGRSPGMRAILWLSEKEVFDATGPLAQREPLTSLAQRVAASRSQASEVIQWTADRGSREAILAMPLERNGAVLGVLMAGTSLADQVRLERSILWTGLAAGLSGIVLGILMGWWTTERVTKPVVQLAESSRKIAAGDWSVRVPVSGKDEIAQMAGSFNQMAGQLEEQRERTVQAERVAAWRELARRLAHELKNPLFPLQLTVENLQRAHDGHPDQFDEVFHESTHTLLSELRNLKTIIGRFSDFAKMPKPTMETVDVDAVIGEVMQLLKAQLGDRIRCQMQLHSNGQTINADPEQLTRALRNLVLNAMDAMPDGGTLGISTEFADGHLRLEISDTGQGLTEEECARLFTPYYTTKQHGTGLGLAIVQSVVSDHGGRISVSSKPGEGAVFTIDLPQRRSA